MRAEVCSGGMRRGIGSRYNSWENTSKTMTRFIVMTDSALCNESSGLVWVRKAVPS